jgi:hypothetical protein
MSKMKKQIPKSRSMPMHIGMMACCALMLLPFSAFFFTGGTIAGLWSNASVFAPIVLCMGAHVLLFKVMGKSCHGSHKSPADGTAYDLNENETAVALARQKF